MGRRSVSNQPIRLAAGAFFVNAGEAGHGIKPAASDDADFSLLQYGSLQGTLREKARFDPASLESATLDERKESV